MVGRRTAADGLTVFTSRHGSATRDEFWGVTVMMLVIGVPLLVGIIAVLQWMF